MIELLASTGPPAALLDVLAVLGTGGLLTVSWQVYLRWKRGGAEDDELVSRISAQVAEGSAKLLEEYRIEVEVAKRQVTLYLEQVTELNRLLGQANERIRRLEESLDKREEDRSDLKRQLKDAVRRREDLIAEMQRLRERVEQLEQDLKVPEHERHKVPDGLHD